MTPIFYSTWVKPVCCVSKISSDCGCYSKASAWKWGCYQLVLEVFFSPLRDLPSRLRRSILSPPPNEKKNLWHPGYESYQHAIRKNIKKVSNFVKQHRRWPNRIAATQSNGSTLFILFINTCEVTKGQGTENLKTMANAQMLQNILVM